MTGCEIEIREEGKKPTRFYNKDSSLGYVASLFSNVRSLAMDGKIKDISNFIRENSTFKPVSKVLYKHIEYFCELDAIGDYDRWYMSIGISSGGKIRHLMDIPIKQLTDESIEKLIWLEQQDLIGATEF